MPTRHSVYGGSNASMWLNCPGGVSLRAVTPPRPVGRAAEEGTAQHEIMDQLLKDPQIEPDKFLGSIVLGIEITKEHIANVKIALEAYLDIEDQFPNATFLASECEVMLTEEAFGTADAAIVDGDRAAIVDFKFGQEEVEADSDQGHVYAVYAFKSIPQFAQVQTFELYIIQPAFDPPVDKLVLPRSVIETFESTIFSAIKVSKSPNPPFVEGDWCKWCHAKLVCPAKTQRLRTLTAPNHVLDLDELGEQVLKLKSWDKWREEAEERIQHELEHGTAVAGWKLVAKRAIRKWIDEATAVLAFKKAGVSETDYMVTNVIGPAGAEKGLLPKKIVKDLAVGVSSGTTIAPASDPRPAVVAVGALAESLKKLA